MELLKVETNFKRGLFLKEQKLKFIGHVGNIERELINIYPDIEFQKIIGFGGAATESSGFCLKQVNRLIADNILNDYFSEKGLNYSIIRVSIGSSDFSLSSYSYLYNENFDNFSIEKDKEYVIPMIKNILSKNPNVKILATPWSPPAFMKDTKRLELGGKLLEKYYKIYAKYLTKYILEYKNNGINIDFITIQNEPNAIQVWESCLFSAEEEV